MNYKKIFKINKKKKIYLFINFINNNIKIYFYIINLFIYLK